MISLNAVAMPHILESNEKPWGLEYEAAILQKQTLPHRYRNDEIRDTLRVETHGKCAYCESRIEHISYSHIEHIKPKSKYPLLVCTWSNLTLACQVCNTNKGSYYSDVAPLLNPYIDAVENIILFYGPMAIDRHERGKLTISILRLNRAELMYQRYEKLKSVSKILDLIERAGGNEALVQALNAELNESLEDSAEYTSCSRCFINAEMESRKIK